MKDFWWIGELLLECESKATLVECSPIASASFKVRKPECVAWQFKSSSYDGGIAVGDIELSSYGMQTAGKAMSFRRGGPSRLSKRGAVEILAALARLTG